MSRIWRADFRPTTCLFMSTKRCMQRGACDVLLQDPSKSRNILLLRQIQTERPPNHQELFDTGVNFCVGFMYKEHQSNRAERSTIKIIRDGRIPITGLEPLAEVERALLVVE
eukprot:3055717-Rhodomonas_salina.2